MSNKQKKILLIDDYENIRKLFGLIFEEKGYEVVLADNGETGIMIMDSSFDAVLIDRQLSRGMLGEEVVSYIKKRYPHTKVILMTSYLINQVVAVARTAGADLVIEKSQDMIDIVDEFLMKNL